MVEVRVGRSKQVPVLLDTGSVGLHIFAPAVSTGDGSGVEVSSTRQSITYSGGSRFTGVEAYAVITIGSQATASAVGFALVRQASCNASKPDCPTEKGMGEEIAAGEYGILGIGVNRAPSGLSSPLLDMPGTLGRTWSIHLRGRSGSRARSSSNHLDNHDDDSPSFTRRGRTRQFVGGRRRGPLLLGGVDAFLCALAVRHGHFRDAAQGKQFAQAPRVAGTSSVLPGTAVAISVDGTLRPFWTFRVGKIKSEDTVFLRTGTKEFAHSRFSLLRVHRRLRRRCGNDCPRTDS